MVLVATAPDKLELLLLAVGRGNHEAFEAFHGRMAGLVRANVRRILREASRAEAVTQQLFTELVRDAVDFDPDQDSAVTWLLMRAHQRAMDELGSVDDAFAASV